MEAIHLIRLLNLPLTLCCPHLHAQRCEICAQGTPPRIGAKGSKGWLSRPFTAGTWLVSQITTISEIIMKGGLCAVLGWDGCGEAANS